MHIILYLWLIYSLLLTSLLWITVVKYYVIHYSSCPNCCASEGEEAGQMIREGSLGGLLTISSPVLSPTALSRDPSRGLDQSISPNYDPPNEAPRGVNVLPSQFFMDVLLWIIMMIIIIVIILITINITTILLLLLILIYCILIIYIYIYIY